MKFILLNYQCRVVVIAAFLIVLLSCPGAITAVWPEEIALAGLKSEWDEMGSGGSPAERRDFFHRLAVVYNAGQKLSAESNRWCEGVLDQGIAEDHMWEFILPDDITDDLLSEKDLATLRLWNLERRIDLYGGIRPFLNRMERTLDFIERGLGTGEFNSEAEPRIKAYLPARREIIDLYRRGELDDSRARQRVLETTDDLSSIMLAATPSGGGLFYVSEVDLERLWGSEEP